MQLLALAWFNNTIKLIETGQSLIDKVPGIGSNPLNPDEILHFDQEDAPRTRFDDRVSPHRVLAPFTVELSALHSIKAALADATLNDLIFATCSGALRRYLGDKNELPDRSLYALVPLHVHDRDDEGVPGHRVQLIRIRLMTHVEDPLERLAYIRKTYFKRPATSFGDKKAALDHQGAAGFPENARLLHEGVMFITAHVVGSNNNFETRDPAAAAEFFARDAAVNRWVADSFAAAAAARAEAVVLAIHADLFRPGYDARGESWPRHSGFHRFGPALQTAAAGCRSGAR